MISISKVSVIIPVYNVENYLEKCLNSLINQSYPDFEIILVNDGSTDKSGVICDIYKIKDKRIKVIHKKNGGVSSARNIGIEQTNGQYITFIDPDDWVENNFLQVLVENAVFSNSDLTVCSYQKVFDNGKITEYKLDEKIIKINEIGIIKYLQEQFLQFKITFSVWNKLYKRELILKHDIRFDPESSYGEDLLFNLFYLSHSNIINITSIPLINYFQRTGSLSQTPKNVLFNATQLASKFKMHLNRHNIADVSPIIFCSEFSTALNHLKNSKNNEYIEDCFKKVIKNKTFKNYCKRVLINKECNAFLKLQGNNFKGIITLKLTLLMLMIGRHSYVINKIIN